MEGKTVILKVLIMSLVMAQIQVEAKSCCPSKRARIIFTRCMRTTKLPEKVCASRSRCIIVRGNICPPRYPFDILENSGDAVNEYCKLGCASSVCDALTILQNPDGIEMVDGAVAQCTEACSNFCTKDSVNAVESA